jgi:hypothetical protein
VTPVKLPRVAIAPHCGKSKHHEQHSSQYGPSPVSSSSNRSPSNKHKRIIGGQSSEAGEWPWLVSFNLNMSYLAINDPDDYAWVVWDVGNAAQYLAIIIIIIVFDAQP